MWPALPTHPCARSRSVSGCLVIAGLAGAPSAAFVSISGAMAAAVAALEPDLVGGEPPGAVVARGAGLRAQGWPCCPCCRGPTSSSVTTHRAHHRPPAPVGAEAPPDQLTLEVVAGPGRSPSPDATAGCPGSSPGAGGARSAPGEQITQTSRRGPVCTPAAMPTTAWRTVLGSTGSTLEPLGRRSHLLQVIAAGPRGRRLGPVPTPSDSTRRAAARSP